MAKDKTPTELCKEIKAPLKKYRQQFEKGWKEEERAYYGDIWRNNQYRPYENGIFQIVESIVPVMTDAMVGTVAQAEDPEFEQQGKILTKSIEWVYQDQNLPLLQPILARKSLISAPGFLYVDYDHNKDNGQGGITLEVVDWRNVWLEGAAPFVDQANKAVIKLDRNREWLKLRYPKHAEKIADMKGDTTQDDAYSDDGRENYDSGGRYRRKTPSKYVDEDTLCLEIYYKKDYSLKSIPEEETVKVLNEESQAFDSGESADVRKWQDHDKHIEAHMMKRAELLAPIGIDPATPFEQVVEAVEQLAEQVPEEDFSDVLLTLRLIDDHIEAHQVLKRENPSGKMPKYKNNWRLIEKVGKEVVYDGDCKHDICEIPLVPFYCYHDGNIYGFGEVRNLIDSQNMQAVMAYKEYKGLQKVANPEKHIDKETGLTEDDITNEDGALYFIPQGTSIRNVPPGQVSPQLSSFQRDRMEMMQNISGVNEVTQGDMQNPNVSGVAIKRIQQQAIGRIRLKQRQTEYYSMVRLGRLVASMILQYWTNEKTIKVNDKTVDMGQVIFNPLEMQDLKYEIKPVPGSMAGVDKDAYNTMLLMFLNGGHLSFEQFLEVAEIPRKEKIAELVNTDRQTAEQLQALQMELVQLKSQFAPQSLTEEEMQILEQMGVAQSDQPEQGVM